MSEQSFTSSGAATAETYPGAPHGGSPLKEKAAATADSMHAEADKLRSAAREQSAAAVEQIKAGVQSATQQARDASRTFVRSQKENLAQRLGAYAEATRAASQKLSEGEGNMLAGPAQTAARQLDRLSGYLRDKEPSDLFNDLETFTRARPEIVFGGLFVAGLAAARFLKASKRSLDRREAIIPTSGPDALDPVPHIPPVHSMPPETDTHTGTQSTTPPLL